MNIATIVTPWAGTGIFDDPFHPLLLDDYPGIAGYEDVTGQPSTNLFPAPNAYTVSVTLDDATLAAIQADSTYVVLYYAP